MNTITKPISRTEAERRGFIVDTHCSPWLGYKGPRFCPTERIDVISDLEAELLEALQICWAVLDAEDRPRVDLLKRVEAAIAKAEGRA